MTRLPTLHRGCRRVRRLALLALLPALCAIPAHATFINCAVPINHPEQVTVTCDWNQAGGAGNSGDRGAPNWKIRMTDTGAPAATNLTISMQHIVNPHGEQDAPAVTRNLGSIVPGQRGAGLSVVRHTGIDQGGNNINHHDIFRYQAHLNASNNMWVRVRGMHEGTPAPRRFEWSFLPFNPGRLQVFESFENGARENPITQGKVQEQGKADKTVDLRTTKFTGNETRISGQVSERATDYRIRYTIGDPFFTDTTLAFVSGEPGSFEEAELGMITDFFVGDLGFLVPQIYDEASYAGSSLTQDLFVAVDLTQWLTYAEFAPPFTVGTPLSLTGGTSDELPGFLVAKPRSDGSSPIAFDPAVGFRVSAADSNLLFSGQAVIGGVIDGHAVPVPGTLMLVAFAGLGLLARRRRAPA